jgi:hypothetical protein
MADVAVEKFRDAMDVLSELGKSHPPVECTDAIPTDIWDGEHHDTILYAHTRYRPIPGD